MSVRNTAWMVLIGVATALVGGYFVARQSNKFQPVRGGAPAQAAHYLASAGMAGIPAALLVALVLTIFTPDKILGDFVKYVLVTLAVVVGRCWPTPRSNRTPRRRSERPHHRAHGAFGFLCVLCSLCGENLQVVQATVVQRHLEGPPDQQNTLDPGHDFLLVEILLDHF
jgi:hypothetical protein